MRSPAVLGAALLCAGAGAFSVVGPVASRCGRALVSDIRMSDEPVRFEVCLNKYCRKKGSAKTLELLEALAEGRTDVIVEKADMSHTEHGCFDECTMGPNVRVGGLGPKTDNPPGRIMNGIKGEEAAAELLGSPP